MSSAIGIMAIPSQYVTYVKFFTGINDEHTYIHMLYTILFVKSAVRNRAILRNSDLISEGIHKMIYNMTTVLQDMALCILDEYFRRIGTFCSLYHHLGPFCPRLHFYTGDHSRDILIIK
jgi:hypothetical protein